MRAQDADSKPLVSDGFDTQCSITTGHRFTDVQGYCNQFTDSSDWKRHSASWISVCRRGEPGDNKQVRLDNYSLTVSGFLAAIRTQRRSSTARKANITTCGLTFSKPASIGIQSNVLLKTDFLDHQQSNLSPRYIRSDLLDLTIHATKNLRFNFEALRNTRDGVNFTTETLDYCWVFVHLGFVRASQPILLVGAYERINNPDHRRRGLHEKHVEFPLQNRL